MKKENILFARRLTAFLIGTVLALGGVALVIQARLGASPSSSLPNAISIASGIPLSRVILMVYAVEIAAQFVLRGKERQWRDLLQIPVALFQSFLLDRFQTLGLFSYDLLWQRVLLMAVGVLFIGVGVFLAVNMRMIPAPPEGLLDALSRRTGINMGLMKNIQDGVTVGSAILVDLIFTGRIAAVGVGTLCSMLMAGRVVALCSKLFLKKLLAFTGME